METLDEDKMFQLENERAEWLTTGYPVEQQRKTADRLARSSLQTTAERQYREMGMRSVVWEFHENKAGTKLFQLLSQIYFRKLFL